MANGRTDHKSTLLVPATRAKSPPRTTPSRLPPIACTVVRPVPSAFDRSTWSVPRTTQNPCCSPRRFASTTAMARPIATRRLDWTTVEEGSRCVRIVPRTRRHDAAKPSARRYGAPHVHLRPSARRNDGVAAERDRQVSNDPQGVVDVQPIEDLVRGAPALAPPARPAADGAALADSIRLDRERVRRPATGKH